MKRFLLLPLLFLLVGCDFSAIEQFGKRDDSTGSNNNRIQEAKTEIIRCETDQLPLFLQEHNTVYSIVIDSVVIISNTEPYRGYLSTTWDFDEKQDISATEWASRGCKDKYVRKTKTVLVKIEHLSIQRNGSCRWSSNWEEAFLQVQDNERR